MSLVGRQDGNLLAIRPFSSRDDFILWNEATPTMMKKGQTNDFLPNIYKNQVKCLCTSGVIVGFLPVQDDEGRATFHCHHGEVGRRTLGSSCDIYLPRFVFREVVEGGSDGAGFVWFLARLVDDVRRCGSRRDLINSVLRSSKELISVPLCNERVPAHPRNASCPGHQRRRPALA